MRRRRYDAGATAPIAPFHTAAHTNGVHDGYASGFMLHVASLPFGTAEVLAGPADDGYVPLLLLAQTAASGLW